MPLGNSALAGAIVVGLISTPLAAQRIEGIPEPDPIPEIAGPLIGPVESRHEVEIGEETIPYRAIFQEYALKNAAGEPEATISGTAYVRSNLIEGANRPIFFFFNGGPGASSSPLHFNAFGPRLREGENGNRIANNPDSILDSADLVFIDPVGTGFSRVLPGGTGAPYWGPQGDARAVLQFVRNWLRDHDRGRSPIFIGGESYGGYRVAMMMRDVDDLNIAGLMLISPALDRSALAIGGTPDRSYVFSLPSMAAAAWFHNRVDRRGLDVKKFHTEVTRFAESNYLRALFQGSELPEAEKRHIATRMAGFIGLSAEAIAEADLRISNDKFVVSLLASEGRRVNRYDTRVAALPRPPGREDRPAAANDLGLGASNAIRSPLITEYMRDELGLPVDRDYVSLTLDVNFSWNWFAETDDLALYYNPVDNIAALMARNPRSALMVVGGLYDLAAPLAAARYAIRHSDIPLSRVEFSLLPAGHNVFRDEGARHRFADRMRAFIRSADAE